MLHRLMENLETVNELKPYYLVLFCFLFRGQWMATDKPRSLGGLESIMDVIGELEVRIIEGNCETVTSLGDWSRQRKV